MVRSMYSCGQAKPASLLSAEGIFYESKFILDSFIFCVSPARFLRWFAAIVDFSTRSRVSLVTYFALTR